ncbi:hypothetical protein [Acidithiobacillus thiooxidans]|uniref:hypothetical protein n=1 Tax=Acidithiobacillus thiooxidans TaxID=930 RepID=UPI001C072E2F|nr:hypothetical protein [Acidithiobacillus thiooxidans]MBU2843556.1 hypothetical protein [Acidithiobacillus thiooxidans]
MNEINDDDKIIQIPETDTRLSAKNRDLLNAFNQRHNITNGMMKRINAEDQMQKDDPDAYKKMMEERYGKPKIETEKRSYCTDYAKNKWETIEIKTYDFEKGGDEHER